MGGAPLSCRLKARENTSIRFQNLSAKPGKVLCVQSPSGIEEFFEHMMQGHPENRTIL